MKSLREIKAEMSPDFSNGPDHKLNKHSKECFSVGFDAGAKAVMEEAGRLVRAMEEISNEAARAKEHGCSVTKVYLNEVIEPALARWQAFVKDGK